VLNVSVIVCTYNRSAVLADTLESFLHLRVPEGVSWELLVVDNNSKDRTREVVEGFAGRLPLRYLFEPRQGKTCALNLALRAAKGNLLLFTDDDVRLDPDWLAAFVEAAHAFPDAGWFGGRIIPWWPGGRPSWLRDECIPALSGYFGLYDLGAEPRRYAPADDPPAGAGMAARRGTFDRVGGYREDLGPRGERKGTNDDSELINRARAAGIPGAYAPAAVCSHLVPDDRLSLGWFIKYGIAKGENQVRAEGPAGPPGSLWRLVSQAVRAVPQALRGRGDRVRICCLNVGMEWGRLRARREQGRLAVRGTGEG
jgi:glycosyltransferase involved in cell wall biosynthesis